MMVAAKLAAFGFFMGICFGAFLNGGIPTLGHVIGAVIGSIMSFVVIAYLENKD